MMLICSYAMNFFDLNLQHMCRNVHLFDIVIFKALEDQTIDKICRLRQTQMIKIYSFNVRQIIIKKRREIHF